MHFHTQVPRINSCDNVGNDKHYYWYIKQDMASYFFFFLKDKKGNFHFKAHISPLV